MNAKAASPSGSTFDAIPSSSMMVGRGMTTVQCLLSMSEATMGEGGEAKCSKGWSFAWTAGA